MMRRFEGQVSLGVATLFLIGSALPPAGAPRAQTETGETSPAVAAQATTGRIATVSAAPVQPVAAQPQAYRVGPNDVVRLRVLAWRDAEGRFDAWPALTGEYPVSPSGTVSVPIAGLIQAAGLTVEELAARVSEKLQAQIRATVAPATAADIIAYGPVYMLGDVQRVGQVVFTPGMTVMQAYALAGGPAGLATANPGLLRQTMRDLGEIRTLTMALARARAREVRLQAEVRGIATLVFPATIRHPDGPEATQQMLNEESAIFEARKQALALELENLSELQGQLETEVEILGAKLGGQEEQIRIVREALGNIESLVRKGLARSPQLVNSQRALIELEGRELDLQTAIFRSRQRISEAERDMVALRARRETESTRELQVERARIEQILENLGTLKAMLSESGVPEPMLDEDDIETVFSVLRQQDGGTVEQTLEPADRLLPGDVLTVTRLLPEEIR
ncbi:MAG: polysaccharide biosynthesis/export family protein [Pseudomonadota bacterium]